MESGYDADKRIKGLKFGHKSSISEQIKAFQARSGRNLRKARHRNKKGENAVWPSGRTAFFVLKVADGMSHLVVNPSARRYNKDREARRRYSGFIYKIQKASERD